LGLVNRYIFRQLSHSWLAVTGVLALALLFNQLAQILAQAAERGYPHTVILPLIGLMSLQNLTVLIPIGLLLGVVLGLGRMYHEREMDALGACGYGPVQLLKPVLSLGLAVGFVLWLLTFVVAPAAFHQAEDLRQEAVRLAPVSQLEPKTFHRLAHDQAVFYADEKDQDGALIQVFLARLDNQGMEVILADSAQIEVIAGNQQLTLRHGVRYDIPMAGLMVKRTYFELHHILLELGNSQPSERRVEGRSIRSLWEDADPRAQAEWQWRLSLPLMVILLALWSIPLGHLMPRENRFAKAGQSILLYFIYANLLTAARTWMEKGTVVPWIGLWWVHVLVALVIYWSWWRKEKWR